MISFKHSCILVTCFAFILIIFVNDVSAKARYVNLEEELQLASIITPAKIISYDSDSLKFQPLDNTVVISTRYSTDPAWNPSAFIHAEWPPKDEKVTLTAEWPPVDAKVIIVTDKENVISIFAWPYGEKYRFWSPMMTGSIATFNCGSLGTPIDLVSEDDPNTSLDGCLVNKEKIITKGVTTFTPSGESDEKSSIIILSVLLV